MLYCSLFLIQDLNVIKQTYSTSLHGDQFHEHVLLKGVGSSNVTSVLQIRCPTKVQNLTFDVLYHVLPDENVSEDVLLGRDILKTGLSVEINNDKIILAKSKTHNCCSKSEPFNEKNIDTDLVGQDRERLINILLKYSKSFIQN